LTRARTGRP
jgi:hypothetical protein